MKTGNIIVYMKNFRMQEITITNVYLSTPNQPRATIYPLEENPRLFFINLPKDQQKCGKNDVEKTGDWFHKGAISRKDSKTLRNLVQEQDSIVHIL